MSDKLLPRFTSGTAERADWEAAFAVCWPGPGVDDSDFWKWFELWSARCRRFKYALDGEFYLNAADLLRPEGWEVSILHHTSNNDGHLGWSVVLNTKRDGHVVYTGDWAPTEAMARAAAALRAVQS